MLLVTTHLSEILENSEKQPVVIFKYSNQCDSSARLKKYFEKKIKNKEIKYPIYLVTVQIERNLSSKIEDWFKIKHESPQIIIINNGKVTHTSDHIDIDPESFVYN